MPGGTSRPPSLWASCCLGAAIPARTPWVATTVLGGHAIPSQWALRHLGAAIPHWRSFGGDHGPRGHAVPMCHLGAAIPR